MAQLPEQSDQFNDQPDHTDSTDPWTVKTVQELPNPELESYRGEGKQQGEIPKARAPFCAA